MNTIISQYVVFKKSNNYEDNLICKIDSPQPYWIAIETKMVMREKFDDLGALVGGSLSEAQKSLFINLQKHMVQAEKRMYSKNECNISVSDIDNFLDIKARLDEDIYSQVDKIIKNVVAIKLKAGINDTFLVASTSICDKTLIMEIVK